MPEDTIFTVIDVIPWCLTWNEQVFQPCPNCMTLPLLAV